MSPDSTLESRRLRHRAKPPQTAPPSNTPPTTRKRKLEAVSQTNTEPVTQKRRGGDKEDKTTLSPAEAALPATPQTLLSDQEAPTMDSDDDVQSMMSGSDDGFGEDQDSSVDFDASMLT